jgi:hypothetical protein
MCIVLLPPGGNPIAVKYIIISRKLRSIWSSRRREYKDGGILGCNTVQSGKYQHFGGNSCTLSLGRRKWRRKFPPKQNRTTRYDVPEGASLLCSSCLLPLTQGRKVAMFMFNDDCCLFTAWRQHLHVHHVYWQSSPLPHRIAAYRLRTEQAASRHAEYLRICKVYAHSRKRWFSSLEVSPELFTPQGTTATYSSGVGKVLRHEFFQDLRLGTWKVSSL